MTEHRFCSCWGPEPALHEGHCCFLIKEGSVVVGREERCPGTTEPEWQATIETARRDADARLAATRAEVAAGHLTVAVAQRRYPDVTDWNPARRLTP